MTKLVRELGKNSGFLFLVYSSNIPGPQSNCFVSYASLFILKAYRKMENTTTFLKKTFKINFGTVPPQNISSRFVSPTIRMNHKILDLEGCREDNLDLSYT